MAQLTARCTGSRRRAGGCVSAGGAEAGRCPEGLLVDAAAEEPCDDAEGEPPDRNAPLTAPDAAPAKTLQKQAVVDIVVHGHTSAR